ncbi:MAG: radical SAM family heme chaperone HemW [Treponema sp.]|nr:radical SAM family heme chaperone HemW [Treponema sp.]
MTEASLYVHVPFCAGKCDYCDFYSLPLGQDDPRIERYVEILLLEGEKLFQKYRPESIPSLYIGGGTPSLLGPRLITHLLNGLSDLVSRYSSTPEEITIEANPESADEAFLEAARQGGVTRLSLGVQSFHGPSRRAVNRIGDEALLPGRLALAAEYFPDAFSVDLISGLPLQDEKILLEDIAGALSYSPAHVSFYALTPEAETPLANRNESLPFGDEADALWLAGREALEKAGYAQYEVSNFCKSGKESRHNIRYWQMRSWLGLGPAASGTIIDEASGTGIRHSFSSDTERFIPVIEELDSLNLIKESFLMGFRYIEGPDEELFQQRFHRSMEELIPKTFFKWQEQLQKDKCALTKDGLLLLNSFLLDVFQELDLSCSELDF